jgi:DEAD/DEAH box helicase domain-containing protein
VRSFDYKVLSAYTAKDLGRFPTFDLLDDIKERVGFRLSLDHVAVHTLGEGKSGDGLQAVAWFKEGKMEELEKYCKKDVEITRRLFEFGCKNGFVIYETKEGQRVRLPVNWNLENILRDLKEAS